MKLEKLTTSLSVVAVVVGLAGMNGIVSGSMAVIDGSNLLLGGLSVILRLIGIFGAYLCIAKKVIYPWISYLWVLPQLFTVSTSQYDKVEQIREVTLNYGAFLLPSFTFSFNWDLANGGNQGMNFNLVAVWLLIFIGWAVSRAKGNEPL